MGWSGNDDLLIGDVPADAFAEAFEYAAGESRRRNGRALETREALGAFLTALALDGRRSPFYVESRRVAALNARHRGEPVRVMADGAPPWLVAEMFGLLDVVAAEYVDAVGRPPNLAELLSYLGYRFLRHVDDDDRERPLVDGADWSLDGASFEMSRERKPEDRSSAPAVDRGPAESPRRVRHAKFGEGVVIETRGDRLVVRFGERERVLLRTHVVDIE